MGNVPNEHLEFICPTGVISSGVFVCPLAKSTITTMNNGNLKEYLKEKYPNDQYKYPNGTLGFKCIKSRGPHAWLIRIYPPLSNSDIEGLITKLGLGLPKEYVKFLCRCNGLKIGLDYGISFFGYAETLHRDIESPQPLDVFRANKEYLDQSKHLLVIGYYLEDGSSLVLNLLNGQLFLTDEKYFNVKKSWTDLDAFFEEEDLSEMLELFNADGDLRDEGTTTLPSF